MIGFLFPKNEPLKSSEEVDPLPLSLPCCTAMFLQKPRVDKPNTGSKEGL